MSANGQSKSDNPQKDAAGTQIIAAGATIGSTIGGAAAGAAAAAGLANVVAAATPITIFGVSASVSPAWWAVIAVNPATAPIAAALGSAFGAYAGYKIAKKILKG
jgi:hypothetical protein